MNVSSVHSQHNSGSCIPFVRALNSAALEIIIKPYMYITVHFIFMAVKLFRQIFLFYQ